MPTDRDRSLEMLLRRRDKDDGELPSAPQCVEAEVLAAWVDGALAGQALADAEKHAASCVRCQALLASMAKTTPPAEARPWWYAVSAKWLVPVAAVATALLVWVSVGPRREGVTAPPPQTTTAATRPEAAPRPVITPQLDQSAQSRADRAKDSAVELRKDAVATPAARGGTGAGGGTAIVTPQRVDALDKTADSVVARPRAGSAGAVTAAPYAASPSPAAAKSPLTPASPPPQPDRAAATPPVSQPQAAAAEKSVAESVKITSEGEASRLAAGRSGGIAAFGGIPEIKSPQPDYRWRIIPPSRIHRSVDGGATWSVVDPVPVPGAAGGVPAIVLTAGSSPSRDVCWIVGRAGLVLVTTDGATWQRRAVPGSPDLISVRAADERAATVTTADNHQYATLDGGATWTLVK